MAAFFTDHQQALNRILHHQNSVVFSSLNQYHEPVRSSGFAIKYVFDGIERYRLNNQDYIIGKGEYLLTNSAQEGDVLIDGQKNAHGICINLHPELISQAVASIIRPDAAMADPALGDFFTSNSFYENKYQARNTALGTQLSMVANHLNNAHFNADELNEEFFLNITTQLIRDQLPMFHQIQRIPVIKAETRKALYKRLTRAREFMDANFTSTISIARLSQEACISEFHFFRLFKAVYHCSPHQYLLRKRLALGKELIETGNCSVSQAALSCGFSDIFTFSKAFKSHIGQTPSALLPGK